MSPDRAYTQLLECRYPFERRRYQSTCSCCWIKQNSEGLKREEDEVAIVAVSTPAVGSRFTYRASAMDVTRNTCRVAWWPGIRQAPLSCLWCICSVLLVRKCKPLTYGQQHVTWVAGGQCRLWNDIRSGWQVWLGSCICRIDGPLENNRIAGSNPLQAINVGIILCYKF
jgi:hypothetical protein